MSTLCNELMNLLKSAKFMELLGIARIVTEGIKVMYKIFILHIVLSIFKPLPKKCRFSMQQFSQPGSAKQSGII